MAEADAHQAPVRHNGFGPGNEKDESGDENVEYESFVGEIGTMAQGGGGEESKREWKHRWETNGRQAICGEGKVVREVPKELQDRTATPAVADQSCLNCCRTDKCISIRMVRVAATHDERNEIDLLVTHRARVLQHNGTTLRRTSEIEGRVTE